MAGRSAVVQYKDRWAGLLDETGQRGTRFVYDAGWTQPIACCFPIDRREHEWRAGLHPFFEHLAPEGWLRQQQARTAHIAEEDDLGLLLRFGSDCIGAVSIEPSDNVELPAINEALPGAGRTVSGVQRKLLVVRSDAGNGFVPAGSTGPAPYIAKFNSENLPTLVRNELLSLRWSAAVLGAREVTDFTGAPVIFAAQGGQADNEHALIVTRFDRRKTGEKLRLEDCAQILCKPRGRDYGGKYDAAYEDVANVIREHSVRPAIDLARFYRRLILFAIIGNCDAHLKNFSMLETPIGLRLSPAYDIVNTAIYDGFDQTLALSIDGQKRQLDRVDHKLLVDFGRSIALPDRSITQIFAELKRKIAGAEEIITPPAGEPPDGFVHRYSEIVGNACLRIFPQ